MLLATFLFSLIIVGNLLEVLTNERAKLGNYGCTGSDFSFQSSAASFFTQTAIVVATVMALCAFVLGLRESRKAQSDGLGMRRQLRRAAVIVVGIIITQAAVRALAPEARVATFIIYAAEIGGLALDCALVGDPLWSTLSPEFRRKLSARLCCCCSKKGSAHVAAVPTSRLSDVLSDKELCKAFKTHLMHEYSVENLMFWLRARWFAEHEFSSDASRLATAQQIVLQHVLPGSDYQVNLPHAMVTALKPVLTADGVESTAFDEAAEEIFRLLERDSFARFLRASADLLMPPKQSHTCCGFVCMCLPRPASRVHADDTVGVSASHVSSGIGSLRSFSSFTEHVPGLPAAATILRASSSSRRDQ
eukprot:PLAT3181.4.p1 GENE.PLAT3181.4~~PLAT3181.4.p1  ORF type:complete len:362 (-),score=84.51 PLAT3181.4:122-1207(-)